MFSPRSPPRSPRGLTKAEQIAEDARNRVPCITPQSPRNRPPSFGDELQAANICQPSQEPAKRSSQISQKSRLQDEPDGEDDEDSTMNDDFETPKEATPMTSARAAPPVTQDSPKDCVTSQQLSEAPASLLSQEFHGLESEKFADRMKGLTLYDKVSVQASIALTEDLRRAEEAIRILSVAEEHDDAWEEASEWELGPLGADDNCRFLPLYGFKLADPLHWKEVPFASGVQIHLSVDEHVLRAGSNWYIVKCKLSGLPNGLCLEWMAPRRLGQLRLDLHDRVKELLGAVAYEEKFQNSRFARHGGPPGTTARLNAWLGVLSSIINNGIAQPNIATLALVFFAAPLPESFDLPPELENGGLRDAGHTKPHLDNHTHLGKELVVC